ncbi:MAG: CHASE domain-containing protein [Opitutaceae bacterium]|nr:CHASE domain-containing protein [Opitutaceae bacterium]
MSPATSQARLRTIVGGITVFGGLLSLAAALFVANEERERLLAEFQRRAGTQAQFTRELLSTYADSVYGLRVAFLAADEVGPDQFARAAADLLGRRSGVQALQWVPLVAAGERAAFEAEAGRRLERPYAIREPDGRGGLRPAGDRADYLPVLYSFPLAGNEATLGYDILSAPSGDFVARARERDQLVCSPQFRLIQDWEGPLGVKLMLPVFVPDGAGPPRLRGLVQGVFLVDHMLGEAHQLGFDEALDTTYFDASARGAEPAFLYRNRAGRAQREPPAADPEELVFRDAVDVGGRTWRVEIRLAPAWAREQYTLLPWLVLAGGLATTTFASLFVRTLLQRARRVEREVADRTAELRQTQRRLEEDIARRIEVERALQASEARLQAVLDHSPNSIFVKDLAGRYLLWNRRFEVVCGRPAAAIAGRTDAELFPAESAAAFREHDLAALAAGRALEFEETNFRDGALRTSIVHKFPLRDAGGGIHALCGIDTDITDRMQAERERREIERKLLEAQKLESLGVLAGGIAHDFNNILTSVLGNASLARHAVGPDSPAVRGLAQIESAARRAADLCQQMLAYAGKGNFVTGLVDCNEVVRGTATLLEVSISKNITLELRLDPDLPAVVADATQLRQIVMNLVLNAADAIGGAAGRITVATAPVRADADLLHGALGAPDLPAGDYVGLEVTDTGCGMTPETIARIFEPFFTTKFSGRGLGLSAVMGIVQSHRGALYVRSEPGRGSTFRLLLPAAAEAPPPAPVAAVGGGRLHGTVLVVDDEETIRLIAAEALDLHGATVLAAAGGEEALRLCRQHGRDIALVLLDMTMPGMSGEDTLRQLRQGGARPAVILMSGYSESEAMRRSADLGVAGFLQKPFEMEALIAKVRPFLGRG